MENIYPTCMMFITYNLIYIIFSSVLCISSALIATVRYILYTDLAILHVFVNLLISNYFVYLHLVEKFKTSSF